MRDLQCHKIKQIDLRGLLGPAAAVWDKINVSAGDKLMARKSRDHSATQTGNGRSRTSPETKPATTTQQHTGSVPLNPEKLKRLYSTMLKCRMIEEKVGGLSIQGKIIGDRCPAVGQEATRSWRRH